MIHFSCYIYSCCFIILVLQLTIATDDPDERQYSKNNTNITHLESAQEWAFQIEHQLSSLADLISRKKDVIGSYKGAQVIPRKGGVILEEMVKELRNMMDSKVSAIRRIMDAAENKALSDDSEPVDHDFSYYNAKEMIEVPPSGILVTAAPTEMSEIEALKGEIKVKQREIILTNNKKFGATVNTTLSSVITFTNVYDRAPEVIRAIKWSEGLNNIFIDNYEKDPSLSWQYFVSSTGFLRQFPASKWEMTPVDLYDGRIRSWYIEAANSPKDVIILVDNSGSMTGQRRDIAKHVVLAILETLGPNDFVNVLTFNETVNEVVPCFRDTLVQANMLNKNEFNLQLDDIETRAIANFTAALIKAFEMLAQFKADGFGAQCNQAIMLVSDGVPFTFQDIFEDYNWQEKPEIPVRVFTYLVGREVADVDKIKWIACENMGYYVHLSTYAEVREDVINFIQVTARPLVLQKNHPVIWSEVYADVVDPKLTEYEWELEERREQKEIFKPKLNETINIPRDIQRWWERRGVHAYPQSNKFNFMVTVSMPVFDRRENATRIANLLGVVATDVPIKDIQRIMMPFMLGVNGYAFLVTNNGHIIAHPDHRPIFLDILKPTYNTVDLLEVELIDDDRPIRDFNQFLYSIREAMINQTSGSKWVFVKQHYDSMKRVSRTKRLYFWSGIKGTPYTLVISFPETYGSNRVQIKSDEDIHRMQNKGTDITMFFNGSNWKVHPDWMYCKHSIKEFATPEAELIYFLKRMGQPGWKWPLIRTPVPPEMYSQNVSNRSNNAFEKDRYYCDRSLIQELVYDAKVTQWFTKKPSFQEPGGAELKERFGVATAFLATHSGLTRWVSYNGDASSEPDFSEHNNRAIDEVWYKRAVEQFGVDNQSFVYSVPFFEKNDKENVLITASHAVFVTDQSGRSAPVAVIGFQFQLSALDKLFKNVSRACSNDRTCPKCGEDTLCYVIDNHGYILLSYVGQDDPKADTKEPEVGKFLGEVRGDIMQRLTDEGIFKRIYIYDYQGVCFAEKGNMNAAMRLQSILKFLFKSFLYIVRYLFTVGNYFLSIISKSVAQSIDDTYYSYEDELTSTLSSEESSKEKDQKFYKLLKIPKTRPQTCDQTITLYQINVEKDDLIFKIPASQCERPFVIVPIGQTNLYMLLIDNLCPLAELELHTDPVEQEYTNSSLACFKTEFNNFYRRRPSKCIRKHENESQIILCGRCSKCWPSFIMLIFVNLLLIQYGQTLQMFSHFILI